MNISTERVTPNKAEQWLNKNRSNRKLREGVAERYAEDMRNGNWTECPTPITFYEDGDVADGQHRLWAIVESDTIQTFVIYRDLPREAGLNIDTGLNRSLVDNARISGVDKNLSTKLVSTARAIAEGTRPSGTHSSASRVAIVATHRAAAEFAVAAAPKVKLLCNSLVTGAVGRAWYHEKDHDKLRRYCDVLGKGFMENEGEGAAVAMRNYLLMKGAAVGTSALWADTFFKIQNSIKYFMLGKKLTVIKAVQDEAYPLPKNLRMPPAISSSKKLGSASARNARA